MCQTASIPVCHHNFFSNSYPTHIMYLKPVSGSPFTACSVVRMSVSGYLLEIFRVHGGPRPPPPSSPPPALPARSVNRPCARCNDSLSQVLVHVAVYCIICLGVQDLPAYGTRAAHRRQKDTMVKSRSSPITIPISAGHSSRCTITFYAY